MKIAKIFLIAAMPLVSGAVFAQTSQTETQRDVNQQTRVEQGLKSGELSTREAAKLEQREAHIDKMQANALKDGSLSTEEAARIKQAQDKTSQAIYNQKHDAQTGNPDSLSSQRMQRDVGRNVRQEQRINNGLSSGALTNSEAAHLEAGQARTTAKEARAGADGHVGQREQDRIQRKENRESHKIRNEKHDQL